MSFDPDAYKKAVTEEWDRAARGWHHWIPAINTWLGEATESMLDGAGITAGDHVIDIAAGDGGQSVAAAHRVGPGGKVLATDIAPEFVNLANAVASRLHLSQLRAEVVDAEALDVGYDLFNGAISRLGLMFLPNPAKGLAEIYRVLRPSGRVSAIVFTTAEKTPFFSIPVGIIREKRGLRPPPPDQLGHFALGKPGRLSELLVTAGFGDVEERVIDAPLRFQSASECVRWRREASGTMQQMLNGLDDRTQRSIWAEIEDVLRRYETPNGFESPCELLICSAVKR